MWRIRLQNVDKGITKKKQIVLNTNSQKLSVIHIQFNILPNV